MKSNTDSNFLNPFQTELLKWVHSYYDRGIFVYQKRLIKIETDHDQTAPAETAQSGFTLFGKE